MMATSYCDPVNTWLGFTSGHYFNAGTSTTSFLPEEDDHHMPPRHRGGHVSKVEVHTLHALAGSPVMPIVIDKGYSPLDTPNGSNGYDWSNEREDL